MNMANEIYSEVTLWLHFQSLDSKYSISEKENISQRALGCSFVFILLLTS